jgi:HPt (histidine-containing phosphotransfer) domain-containing protein
VDELAARCMGNATIAGMLLEKFEQQLRKDVESISARAAEHDAARLAGIAHALKGAAASVAAGDVRAAAARIEFLAREDSLDSIQREIELLRGEIDRCLAYLPEAKRELARDAKERGAA